MTRSPSPTPKFCNSRATVPIYSSFENMRGRITFAKNVPYCQHLTSRPNSTVTQASAVYDHSNRAKSKPGKCYVDHRIGREWTGFSGCASARSFIRPNVLQDRSPLAASKHEFLAASLAKDTEKGMISDHRGRTGSARLSGKSVVVGQPRGYKTLSKIEGNRTSFSSSSLP